jgi:hypothetical protein
VDFHEFTPGSKSFGIEIQTVYAKREVLEKAKAVGGNPKCSLESVPFAQNFSASSQTSTRGVADFETHFTALSLGRGLQGAERKNEAGQAKENK